MGLYASEFEAARSSCKSHYFRPMNRSKSIVLGWRKSFWRVAKKKSTKSNKLVQFYYMHTKYFLSTEYKGKLSESISKSIYGPSHTNPSHVNTDSISQSPQMNALTSSILIFYNEPKNVQLAKLLSNTLHFITNSVLSPLTNTFSKTFVFMWGETPLKATWPYYSVSVWLSTVHTKPSGNTFSFPRSSRTCAFLSCPWTPASFQNLHLYPSTWKRYLGFN